MNWKKFLGYALVLSCFLLTGCVQDSPSSSKERTVSLLLELLRDEEPEMRRTAVESLGKIGDRGTAVSILPLLQDPTAIVREASVLALGRVKPTATDEMVGLFMQTLEDPAEAVQQAAAVVIGEIEPAPRLLQPVVGLLRSSDVMTRRAAVRALLQIDASQSVDTLVEAGRDSNEEVRQGIVAAVGEWGGAAASPWLRERLAHDPSPQVRAEAAYRLGIFSDPETKAALEQAVAKDTNSAVRIWAKRGS